MGDDVAAKCISNLQNKAALDTEKGANLGLKCTRMRLAAGLRLDPLEGEGREGRVTIRPSFPGHVLFFGLCPGGFLKISGLSGFLAQSASTFERCQLQRLTTA